MPFGIGPAGWFLAPYIYPQILNFYQNFLKSGGFPYYGFTMPFYGAGLFGDELSYLKQLKQNLELQLQDIEKRIKELEVNT